MQALATSESGNEGSSRGSIASSTFGILFFGTPKRSQDALQNLASWTSTDNSATPESPLMKALKRDLIWMNESNARFSDISNQFQIKYFTEAAEDVESDHTHVSMMNYHLVTKTDLT